ncbi:MAG: choice-of-anchor W domain-containing protein [Cyanobacteriota bacterium]|nr:choice-of-anchor W domain-containing protein [Cyanobacteriota bacterium]
MNKNSVLLGLSMATLGVVASATTANAVSFMALPSFTDADFNNLLNNGTEEPWAVESRIGNAATNGTQELGILDGANNLLPVVQGQRVWTNGEEVDFKVTFDGSLLTYIVGGQTLSTNAFDGQAPITDLFFRARSTDTSSLSLTNLMVDGVAIPDLVAEAPDTVEYLKVSDFGGAFTIMGTSTFSWTGERPRNSQLAYQIKATRGTDVPEPATLSLLSLGTLGLLGTKLRRKSQ